MLRNNDNQYLLSNNNDDDAITVQVSDANSNLGNLLLEADWDEVSDYLSTPEAQHDVDAKNDPLGILNSQSGTNKLKQIPSSKHTAFFASLFVRAPYNIIEKVYNMAPSHVDQPEDLMYVLSIIPSEEESRLAELQKRAPHRTRSWSSSEYCQILHLLLKSFQSSKTPTSTLLHYWPSWIIGSSVTKLTPLAIAAYNPDVPANIIQLLCTLEPDTINEDCTYQVHTIPIYIAASSPIPPKSSDGYEHAKNERWMKVKLLTLSKTWYIEQKEVLLKTNGDGNDSAETNPLYVQPAPEPTLQQIQYACEDAMKRNEWELVREFMKQYCSGDDSANKELTSIQTKLAKHDEKINAIKQRRDKSRAREEWLHKNMGLVMYPIDAVMDLVSVVMPTSKSKDGESGIVSRMS